MKKPSLLIIGGAGIVGSRIAEKGIQNGFDVFVVALEEGELPLGVKQIIVDRTKENYRKIIKELNETIGRWDIVVDAFAFDCESACTTYDLFNKRSKHIITISTTLVYDRSTKNDEPITEDNPLAKKGVMGGYVDGKLDLEAFWLGIKDVPWTIIRPYHILGANSLIGCLPEHNRDPEIIQTIKNGSPLRLCEGGNVKLNYIHPQDIASAIFAIANNQKTFGEAYNLVNPEVVIAKDYYAEIARQVDGILNIQSASIEKIWQELKGWELTTLPHVYSARKLGEHTGFIASIPLSEGIRDAIQYCPRIFVSKEKIPIHKRMNKLPRPEPIDWLNNYYK